ncbi:Trm112 family protein [Candidatus Palibaumannia cicadellinicola]|uniref:Methyltransferase activator Trm112 homolog n=1 Tax=Baumannia cicadellinicola subsp. Homalodisca coagulata TaxID=374463 RepID=Y256_BAUCH|nr:Trm112 family protein [Candidatus Baumannia cicadellinicola]Q1LTK8.1 RecName: Full=UPF0434 protein BCI_0256 [Baumannia cicadellinicola str. Hc (Homalodisca coagulata)]ABF13917.1 conserved hypothetical protein [Baumannia cicadellinicola str. Hc (Homalodisca coagulata)]MBS0032699.1 Trm112 family protein [Candidatus Baumannia cicadellinicola]MCJ7462311.1 Trm112 family protein [Candidatus Baumannia cicadellinicola]MCJ7462831.1 Trm112 family protein [Candidatus Baumannia cicadellinicola]
MEISLLNIIACPLCQGQLLLQEQELVCQIDALAYPVRTNIPVLLVSEARNILVK